MNLELHSVWNAYEEIQFNGTRLAHTSTEMKDSVRWIEIEIYKTERGKYVIHRIGVSLVYHSLDTESCVGKGVRTKLYELDPEATPCKDCRPPRQSKKDHDYDFVVSAEQDRHTADVCKASEVQERLKVRPYRGEPFLSSPARKALDQAIAADPALSETTSSVRFVD